MAVSRKVRSSTKRRMRAAMVLKAMAAVTSSLGPLSGKAGAFTTSRPRRSAASARVRTGTSSERTAETIMIAPSTVITMKAVAKPGERHGAGGSKVEERLSQSWPFGSGGWWRPSGSPGSGGGGGGGGATPNRRGSGKGGGRSTGEAGNAKLMIMLRGGVPAPRSSTASGRTPCGMPAAIKLANTICRAASGIGYTPFGNGWSVRVSRSPLRTTSLATSAARSLGGAQAMCR